VLTVSCYTKNVHDVTSHHVQPMREHQINLTAFAFTLADIYYSGQCDNEHVGRLFIVCIGYS